MRTYYLNKLDRKPLYEQLYEELKKDIIDGNLKAQEKLPSKRVLSSNLGVSVITVQKAYDQLSMEGYIEAREKSGNYVSAINPIITSHNTVEMRDIKRYDDILLDLTSNQMPKELFPISRWLKIHRFILNEHEARFLMRSPSKGSLELRKAICKHLKDFSGIDVNTEQIVVSSGSDNIYNLLIQLLGLNLCYASEDPGYPGFLKVLHNYGIKGKRVKVDEDGCEVPLELIDVIHISPAHQFPTGVTMKISRRYQLLDYINEINGYIIEDDYDSEFRLKGNPIPSLFSIAKGKRVIYMNTFSKTLSSSLKISYCVLPLELLPLYDQRLSFYSCSVPLIDQLVLKEFIDNGYFVRHIAKVRNYYRNLKKEIITKLDNKCSDKIAEIKEEDSGLHFLLKLKDGYGFSNNVKILKVEDYSLHKGDETYIFNYSHIKEDQIDYLLDQIIEV